MLKWSAVTKTFQFFPWQQTTWAELTKRKPERDCCCERIFQVALTELALNRIWIHIIGWLQNIRITVSSILLTPACTIRSMHHTQFMLHFAACFLLQYILKFNTLHTPAYFILLNAPYFITLKTSAYSILQYAPYFITFPTPAWSILHNMLHTATFSSKSTSPARPCLLQRFIRPAQSWLVWRHRIYAIGSSSRPIWPTYKINDGLLEQHIRFLASSWSAAFLCHWRYTLTIGWEIYL